MAHKQTKKLVEFGYRMLETLTQKPRREVQIIVYKLHFLCIMLFKVYLFKLDTLGVISVY